MTQQLNHGRVDYKQGMAAAFPPGGCAPGNTQEDSGPALAACCGESCRTWAGCSLVWSCSCVSCLRWSRTYMRSFRYPQGTTRNT